MPCICMLPEYDKARRFQHRACLSKQGDDMHGLFLASWETTLTRITAALKKNSAINAVRFANGDAPE